MYDLYHREAENGSYRADGQSSPSSPPPPPPPSVGPKWHPTGILYPWSHPLVQGFGIAGDPVYYAEQNIVRRYPPGSRLKSAYTHSLIRGRPLFAEVDFVPSKYKKVSQNCTKIKIFICTAYIPAATYYVALSVSLPAHIRGRPWILGWHQEVFPVPTCRLCTNTGRQSFTLPVTLFLPDDGWCPEGRVPTVWKIEALRREQVLSSVSISAHLSPPSIHPGSPPPKVSLPTDQTDMILAYGYDELRQLTIGNDQNSTVHCRGISEAIVAWKHFCKHVFKFFCFGLFLEHTHTVTYEKEPINHPSGAGVNYTFM